MFLRCNHVVPLCTSPPFINTTPACPRLNFCKSFFLSSYLCLPALSHSIMPRLSLVPHPRSLMPRSFLMPCLSLVLRSFLVPCPSLVLCVLCPCLVPHPHSLIPRPFLLCAMSLPHPHPHTLHAAPTPFPLAYLGCTMSQCLRAALDASPLASVHVPATACTCIRIIGLD